MRYDGTTGDPMPSAGNSGAVFADNGNLTSARGIVFGPDGNLYVTSRGTDQVLRYNGSTGAFIDAFVPARSGGLEGAFCLSFGPDGNLYVCSFGSSQVLRYDGHTGAFTGVFIPAGGELNGPTSLVFRTERRHSNDD